MASYRLDSEEEALFRSYPYALYFVQSPSNLSHANSNTNFNYDQLTCHSPINQEAARLVLSGYSSSRGSNNFFLQPIHKKKFSHDESIGMPENGEKDGAIVKNGVEHDQDRNLKDFNDDDDDGEYNYDEKNEGWIKYFSFSYSNSGWWILMQLSWRFLLSLMIALVVFYVAAKPPSPKLSIKIAGIRQFRLGEGVDASGVATKILSCNCSIDLVIDNNSKLFALHIHPPTMQIFFGHLPFAMSQVQGRELYAGNDDLTLFRLNVGTRNKPMYGAGRNMQDLLDSGKGLPLVIKVSLRSSFHVVWGVIEPKFHHEAQCLVVLGTTYDKKHGTQVYNSTCVISS